MRKRWIAAVLLIAWSAILVRVLVFKNLAFSVGHLRFRIATKAGDDNFVPLRTIASYLRGDHGVLIGAVNLVGNVAPFAPIGFLVPLIFRGLAWQEQLALAVGVGLAVEGLEAAFGVGEFDVDDLILNALGVALGYGALVLTSRPPRRPAAH